jgi:DNA-binding transcriptional ArsR family regulator
MFNNTYIFNALAVPTRLHIVELLAKKGKLTSTEISKRFDVSAPAISQHLKILREAKIVKMEKQAQQRIYQLDRESILKIEDWIKKVTQKYDERYNELDKVLKTLQISPKKESNNK